MQKECTKASKRAVRRSKGTGTSNAFKPTDLLYKEAWDDKKVLTPNTHVTIVVQTKKSTRLLKVSCQLKKVRASEGTYAVGARALVATTRGSSVWELVWAHWAGSKSSRQYHLKIVGIRSRGIVIVPKLP